VWTIADQDHGVRVERTGVPDAGHTCGLVAFSTASAALIGCLQASCSSHSSPAADMDDGSLHEGAARDSTSEAADVGPEAGQVGSPCNPGPEGMLVAPICLAGLACCVDQTATTALCQTGPCPYVPSLGMPGQLCLTDADCFTRGDVCGPPAPLPGPVVAFCHPPSTPDGAADSTVDGSGADAPSGE
jgi:hypothetical protein